MREISVFVEILLAAIFGGLIGLERELARKPAGLRTHILVAMASTLLVILGDHIIRESDFPEVVSADPVRIIQAIIVGISFLGAGTILHREEKGRIEGLTTSASVLVTAAIGITIALELFLMAFLTTITVIMVNYILNYVEDWLVNKLKDNQQK